MKQCVTCQRFKGEKGLEQQWKVLPAVSQPHERLGLDLTDMVAGNHGYRYSLTVIDHYKVKLGAYAGAARGLGAHLRDISP